MLILTKIVFSCD